MLTGGVWLAQLVGQPREFLEFLDAFNAQVIGRDKGYGPYGYLVRTAQSEAAGLVLHGLLILAIAGYILRNRSRIKLLHGRDGFTVLSYLAIATVILANPRLKEYDFSMLVTLLVAYLLNHGSRDFLRAAALPTAAIALLGNALVPGLRYFPAFGEGLLADRFIEIYLPIAIASANLIISLRGTDQHAGLLPNDPRRISPTRLTAPLLKT